MGFKAGKVLVTLHNDIVFLICSACVKYMSCTLTCGSVLGLKARKMYSEDDQKINAFHKNRNCLKCHFQNVTCHLMRQFSPFFFCNGVMWRVM